MFYLYDKFTFPKCVLFKYIHIQMEIKRDSIPSRSQLVSDKTSAPAEVNVIVAESQQANPHTTGKQTPQEKQKRQFAEQQIRQLPEIAQAKEQMKQMLVTYEKTKKAFDRTKFGKFTEIGSGSFSKAYTTIQDEGKQTAKTIVIKQMVKTEPIEINILKEVEILSYLQNVCDKYVLCFIDFMEDEKYFYILTEYLGNYITLSQFIKESSPTKMGPVSLTKIIENLKTGLDFCHQHGIAHRDVKPANIMIDPKTLSIKYIDFGSSCHNEVCFDQDIVGSPVYMAPEFFLSYRDPRYHACPHPHAMRPPLGLSDWIRADYWSLGVTIIEIFYQDRFIDLCSNELRHVPINVYEDVSRTLHELFKSDNLERMFWLCCQKFPIMVDMLHAYLKSSVFPLISLLPKNRVMMVDQGKSFRNPSFVPIKPPK